MGLDRAAKDTTDGCERKLQARLGSGLIFSAYLCVSPVNRLSAHIYRRGALPQNYESHLDRVSTGSDSDLVKPRESKIVRKYRMLITDQVAIAPCTDPI